MRNKIAKAIKWCGIIGLVVMLIILRAGCKGLVGPAAEAPKPTTPVLVKLGSLFEPLRHRFGRLAEKSIEAMKRAHKQTVVEELKS